MTFVIHRYPVHLIDVVRVGGGRRATIRPVLPQDEGPQMEFFRSLSTVSRYNRFMTRFREPPAALVSRFVNVDYRNHMALLAEDGCGRVVGEARFVADKSQAGLCELAIAVADDWQGSGLARTLLDRLEREANRLGFRLMIADTLISNGPMLGLSRRAGYAATASPDDASLVRLEKVLAPGPAAALAA